MGCGKKWRNRKKKDREKLPNKKRARTTQFNQFRADAEVAKRVQVALDKLTTIKIMDCEFCLHRRFSDNWCMKHKKEISPKQLACQEFAPGGPDETARAV